jgi:hypothetical protein
MFHTVKFNAPKDSNPGPKPVGRFSRNPCFVLSLEQRERGCKDKKMLFKTATNNFSCARGSRDVFFGDS